MIIDTNIISNQIQNKELFKLETNANSRRLRTTLNFFQVSIKTLVIVSASIQISVFQLLKAQNPERVPYINILAIQIIIIPIKDT